MTTARDEDLRRAVQSGTVEALQLEGGGADRRVGGDGLSLLHWACSYGQTEIVQYLLEQGANVAMTTKHGWTGAHICAIRGNTACLTLLSLCGVDLEAIDARGYTCAHLAAIHGKIGVTQALVKAGVDLSVADRRGWTVIHHAAFHGRLGVLQTLLKQKLDSELGDREGNSPIHLAAAEGHLDCLRLLVYHKHRAKEACAATNGEGATPKDLASRFQRRECFDFLSSVANEVEVSDCSPESAGGEYPAHAASYHGNTQLLSMLVQEGHCGVNDRNPSGETPAHKAASQGHTKTLQWLVDRGADVTIQDNAGETPTDIAKRVGQLDCVAVLTGTQAAVVEGGKSEGEGVTGGGLEWARQRVRELRHMLEAARSQFLEMGGAFKEDEGKEERGREHRRLEEEEEEEVGVALAEERERREELEAELDRLRKRLQQLECGRTSTEKEREATPATPPHPTATPPHPTSPEEHSESQHTSRYKTSSTSSNRGGRRGGGGGGGGGCFVRVDHW